MLFQSVVLPCQYNSVSTQTPVVQWVYKSYCRDRTRDSFSHTDSLNIGLGGSGLSTGTGGAGGGYETGMATNHIDCADSSRTVRTVASISGSSVTLSEYYKNRDISIINSKTSVVETAHLGVFHLCTYWKSCCHFFLNAISSQQLFSLGYMFNFVLSSELTQSLFALNRI